MQEITMTELQHCVGGGISLSGTLINSFIRGMSLIIEIGRSFGTAIRRWHTNSVCKV